MALGLRPPVGLLRWLAFLVELSPGFTAGAFFWADRPRAKKLVAFAPEYRDSRYCGRSYLERT